MRLRSPLTTTAPTALLVALLAACAPAPETAATTTATGPGAADAPPTTAPGVETIGKLTTFDPAFATAVAADARIEKLTGDAFTWSEGPTWVRNGGYLLFDEVPTGTMLVGVGLIVAAGLVIIHRERKLGLERARARRAVTPQG